MVRPKVLLCRDTRARYARSEDDAGFGRRAARVSAQPRAGNSAFSIERSANMSHRNTPAPSVRTRATHSHSASGMT